MEYKLSANLTYKIKLPEFEGPFDLLLFFIERDELDIYDIPISSITNDFLEYLRQLEEMNIDSASEFILVASTLMRIKAKMLLPRKEIDEAGNEIDPRTELVERLLEYRKYKSVIEELKALEANRQAKINRGNVIQELQLMANKAMADAELENLSLFNLLSAFQSVLSNFEYRTEKTEHTVVKYNYSLDKCSNDLLNRLDINGELSFKGIFKSCENRIHAIYYFLAILDLLQQEEIEMEFKTEAFNSFKLKRA